MTTSATGAWALERDADGIAWLSFDKPGTSTNVLSRDALVELDSHLKTFDAAPPRGVVIRSAKKSGFIAGADVREFTQLTSAEQAVRAGARGAERSSITSNRCRARPWPSFMASRSAVASSSHWRAAIASACAATIFRLACPK